MPKSRTDNWVTMIVVAVAVIPVTIAGLWMYMTATATALHPNVTEVPSVERSAASPKFTDAAGQGRQIVRASLTEQNLPGLSVAVGVGGEIVWAAGFGFADLEKRTPIAPETQFRIGTASTVLTSAAIGLLLEQGRLKLDDVIQTYVPAFPEKLWPVTVRQLMGHMAGVRTDSGDEGPLFSEHCERPVEALRHFAAGSLLFEPGTQHRYSSYGWIVLSAAVEAAAKEPFLTFMRRQVFQPLNMRYTRAESAMDPVPDRATFYFPRFASDPHYGLDLMRDLDYSCYAGSSVFLSTPSDLVRFGLGIQSGKLLRTETVQLFQTSQRLPSGQETGYGLGWDLETIALGRKQTRVVGHNGDSLGGMVASLMVFPDHGITVSVLSNASYADTAGVALKVAQVFKEQGNSPAGR